jgi:hypothetical protein
MPERVVSEVSPEVEVDPLEVQRDDVFLGLIAEQATHVCRLRRTDTRTLWFLTPSFAVSLLRSLVAIAVYRRAPSARPRSPIS